MQANITLTEEELKRLIEEHLTTKFRSSFNVAHLRIQVKSKQNYKSEWEEAAFRATYTGEF